MRDDRAARPERCPTLADDEARRRRRGSTRPSELAGDPLEPLEPVRPRPPRRGGPPAPRRGPGRSRSPARRGVASSVVTSTSAGPYSSVPARRRRTSPRSSRPGRCSGWTIDAARAPSPDDLGELGRCRRSRGGARPGRSGPRSGPAAASGRRGRRVGSNRPAVGNDADRRRAIAEASGSRGDRRHAAERAVGLDEVDEAPVGEVRDRERAAAAWIVSSRSSPRRDGARRRRRAGRGRRPASGSCAPRRCRSPCRSSPRSCRPRGRAARPGRTCQRYAPSWRRRRTVASSASSCARAAAQAAANSARSSSWRCSHRGELAGRRDPAR